LFIKNPEKYTHNGSWKREDGTIWLTKTTLSEVIRYRRLLLGISQRALAEKLRTKEGKHCSPQTLNNIEMGLRSGRAYWDSMSMHLSIPYAVFIYYGELKDHGYPMLSFPYADIERSLDGVMTSINGYMKHEWADNR
jgi:transcriptional regulator with XRE-family HTH domain